MKAVLSLNVFMYNNESFQAKLFPPQVTMHSGKPCAAVATEILLHTSFSYCETSYRIKHTEDIFYFNHV